jgi:hypothetical protein
VAVYVSLGQAFDEAGVHLAPLSPLGLSLSKAAPSFVPLGVKEGLAFDRLRPNG